MTTVQRNNYEKNMMLALFPLVFCGSVLHGARVWLLCGIAMLTAKAVDVLMSMVLKTEYDSTDHSSELSALIFTLMLPVSVPLYALIVPIVITVLVGKHLFGGRDVYPFNLAALAMCCAAVNWEKEVLGAVAPFAKVALISGETAGASVSNAGIIKAGGVPPYNTIDMLLGNYPGVMGADFVLVIIVIGLFMILRGKITWHVPVSFLATCAVIAFAFPRIYGFSRVESLELEMLNGAVFFVALFMLADPNTTPRCPKAKIAFGVITGVLGMIFRYMGGFNIGTCFALLLVNSMDRYIDRVFEDGELGGMWAELKAAFAGGKKEKKAAQSAAVTPEEMPAVQPEQMTEETAHTVLEKQPEAVEKKEKHIYKAEKSSDEEKTKRAVKSKTDKTEKPKRTPKPKKEKVDAMELISEAEDRIDDVIYSTRTISIDEILKAEAEMKRKKGEK